MVGKIVRSGAVSLLLLFIVGNIARAQLLDNDTLYIGSVSGSPGDTVVVSVDIVTSELYAGWQIPIVFGYGNSPFIADSIDLEGSIMTDTTFRPGGWDFIAPFLNNNQWDNVQTCGVAGIIWLSPPVQDLLPGFYHVMNLVFFIDDTASAQTIPLDTLGASWYPGGPVNHYLVVVPPGYSRYTHVVQGSIEVVIPAVDDNDEHDIMTANTLTVYPSIVQRGSSVRINYSGTQNLPGHITLCDAAGRKIYDIFSGRSESGKVELDYKINNIPTGVYFIVVDNGAQITGEKLIIR